MSLLIEFPTIPELVTGQVLGAAQLNAYSDAVQWLLGYAVAPQTMQGGMEGYSDESPTGEAEGWRGYIRHTYPTLHWLGRVKRLWLGSVATVSLQYYGNDSAWHEVTSFTEDDPVDFQVHEVGVDLTTEEVAGYLTVGKVYRWRVVISSANIGPWHFAETNSLASGWAAPATFTNGVVPTAANLNTLRSAANALYQNGVPPVYTPFVASLYPGTEISTTGLTPCAEAVFRYRPGSVYLMVSINGQEYPAPVNWDVLLVDQTGQAAKLCETKLTQHTGSVWEIYTLDLAGEPAATNLAAAGITLTEGEYYLIMIQAIKQRGGDAEFQRAILGYIPVQTPAPTWATPKRWSHGDQVAAAELNKYGTDLTLLYTGGAMALQPEVLAQTYWTSQRLKYPRFGFARQKRYLYYHHKPGDTRAPRVSYGASFTYKQDLASASDWQIADLDGLGIAAGTYYELDYCDGAYECDVETDTAGPEPA